MRTTIGLTTTTALALTLVAACAHRSSTASTTTITSGEPSGVRVTNVKTADRQPRDVGPGLLLADELCKRELSCNRIGPGGSYRSEEACMADYGARAPALLASWTCSPAAERARFEECLAQVRSEGCETDLSAGVGDLPRCRANVMCP